MYKLFKDNLPTTVVFNTKKEVDNYINSYAESSSIEWRNGWFYKLRTSTCVFEILNMDGSNII